MEAGLNSKSYIGNKSNLIIYSICFLCIFNLIFFPGITDGKQTSGIFVLVSIGLIVINALLYWIIKYFLKKAKIIPKLFADYLIIFWTSELSVFCISGGKISLFGLLYDLHYYDNTTSYPDILIFREKTSFALSISFLISVILCIILKMVFGKKSIAVTNQPTDH